MKMLTKYERKNYSNAKYDAQLNLEGRTSYVDDDTLRFHKARIHSTYVADNGLLFALIESVAADPNGRERGFRHVIFDITGRVLNRPSLDSLEKTSDTAIENMWHELNAIDAKAVTREGLEQYERAFKSNAAYINELLERN